MQAHQVTAAIVNAALESEHKPAGSTALLSPQSQTPPLRPCPPRLRKQLHQATEILRAAMRHAMHPPFAASLLLSHHSARHLWTSNPLGPLACTMEWERFKKVFLVYAKELSPTTKELEIWCRALTDATSLAKQQPIVTLVRLSLLTDRWGVLGSFLRLTRSEMLPSMGGEVIVIEGISDKDLLYGEPVRNYLDACGTVYRYQAVKNGVAIEFEEESGVMQHITGAAKEKGPLAKKGVFAHPSSTIDDLAKLSRTRGKSKKKEVNVNPPLLEECLLQHKLLEDEINSLEKRSQQIESEEDDWCQAEIERRHQQVAWLMQFLDILAPSKPGNSSPSRSSKEKKKKTSTTEAKARRLTVDLSSVRNSYILKPTNSLSPRSNEQSRASALQSPSISTKESPTRKSTRFADPPSPLEPPNIRTLVNMFESSCNPSEPPPLPSRLSRENLSILVSSLQTSSSSTPIPLPRSEPLATDSPLLVIDSVDSLSLTSSTSATRSISDSFQPAIDPNPGTVLSATLEDSGSTSDEVGYTLSHELEDVFRRLRSLESAFSHKDKALESLQKQLNQEKKNLETRIMLLAEKEQKVNEASMEVNYKQRELEAREKDLLAREAHLTAVLVSYEQKHAELSFEKAEFVQQQRGLKDEQRRLRDAQEALEQDRNKLMITLTQADHDREARERDMEELLKTRQQLISIERDLERRHLQITEREKELKINSEIDAHKTVQDVMALQNLLKQKEQEIDALKAQVAKYSEQSGLCGICQSSVANEGSSSDSGFVSDVSLLPPPVLTSQRHSSYSSSASYLASPLPPPLPLPVIDHHYQLDSFPPPIADQINEPQPPSCLPVTPPTYMNLPEDLPPPPLPSPVCSPRSDDIHTEQDVSTPPPPPPPPLSFNPALLSLKLSVDTLQRLSSIPDSSVSRMQKIARGWLFRRRARRLSCWVSGVEVDMIRARNRAFRELVESERSYIECMSDCKQAFMKPMFSSAATARSLGDDSLVSEEQVKQIFGSFDLILQVNMKFVGELEACARDWHNHPHAGPLLNAWTPVMKLYVAYVKNYEQNEAVLQKCEKKPRFVTLLQECKAMAANRRKLPLSAYLIMPIQRVARYRLLALEILKHTPEYHQDRKSMEQAAERLEELCTIINESKRDADKRKMSLQLLMTRIVGAPSSLASPSRVFIMEGPLSVVETRSKEYYCFLFNDLFLRTKKKRKGCMWKGETPLGNVALIDVADSPSRRHAFQLLSEYQGRATSIVVCAPTSAAKADWMLAISLNLISPMAMPGSSTAHRLPSLS